MASKKPLVANVIASDTSGDAIDIIKDIYTQFKNAFNEYCDGTAEASVTDRIVGTTRVVDLTLSLPGCDYAWNYSANATSATRITVYVGQVNKNLMTAIGSQASYIYDKSTLINTNARNSLYCLCTQKSFIVNIVLGNNQFERILFSSQYMYGMSIRDDGSFILTDNADMSGFIAGTTNKLIPTRPQVISQKAGTCVVREVLYSDGKKLDDENIKLFTCLNVTQLVNNYAYLKGVGVNFLIGYSYCSIWRINEDA